MSYNKRIESASFGRPTRKSLRRLLAAHSRRYTIMHRGRTLALLALATFSPGCAIHDGAFVYKVTGRLIDESAAPLSDRGIHVQLEPFAATAVDFAATTRTGIDGQFSKNVMTGLAWGYRSVMGIPIGPKHPKAPRLEVVYVAVERASGNWRQMTVPLSLKQQAEPTLVELGDLRTSD